jgi:hypothetical protein
VAEWSEAVDNLSNHAGTRNADFLLLLSQVDEVRAKAQRAKAAYSTHMAEHGC